MATAAQNLQTAVDNISAKIAEVSANPKPNYSIDGQSVSHADYFRMLTEQYGVLNELIAAGTPFEITTEVY
jgi:hypothetical protein